MTVGRSVKEIREFYNRWKAPVFRFCVLFMGDEERASDATGQAFLRYLKEAPDAATNQLPHGLLRFALEAARQHCVWPAPLTGSDGLSFREAIVRLPYGQRAVFILRNVLRMDRQDTSKATGLSVQQIEELWVRSILTLREQLQREFFKEKTQ